MTYRQFAEHAKRQARNMRRGFDSPDDDWPPSMLIELPGDGGLRPSLVGIPPRYFDSADGKDFLTTVVLPTVIRGFSVRKLALILSSWVVKAEVTPEMREALGREQSPLDVAPSQHADRIEALLVNVYDAERVEMWMAEITRYRRRPPTLGEWEGPGVGPDEQLSGRIPAIQEAFR